MHGSLLEVANECAVSIEIGQLMASGGEGVEALQQSGIALMYIGTYKIEQ